ncbi:threonine kinase [Selenomonas ruminantium]|uniref:Threonine kinase n=1 Tax=Selenomonas ruminantium TaxID=971 RepID=A0A1M6SMH7_SELRU|nr:hypothetical protein [Selenomonas ruminantium]SHK45798.1 threonine kinase [Selenomonas ruminantium]
MRLMVRVPGSCGELIQGVAHGEPFLGTCPIDRYTTVQVSDEFSGQWGLGEKSRQAFALALSRLGRETFPYGMRLQSELPQGKGMASSSADIAAVVVSVMEALHESWSLDLVMEIATQIEPTDGVFCPGLVLMNHISGRVLTRFASVPALRAAIFDVGGTVDTCAFHQEKKLVSGRAGMEEMLQAFCQAVDQGQAEQVARLATQSAFYNQAVLYKEELEVLWQLGRAHGAWGINAAHSGTVFGMWWDSAIDEKKIRLQAERIAQAAGVEFLGLAQLRSGGVEVDRV